MIYALIDDKKVRPTKGAKGICPCCGMTVIAKCGEININHWSHQKNESCDTWFEPETLWHYIWKLTFGIENTEKIIYKLGNKHIADIFTKQEVVIELQNSPISNIEIRERELFYGEKMLWIINGKEFKDNFETNKKEYKSREWIIGPEGDFLGYKNEEPLLFNWRYPRKSWAEVKSNVFIDFGLTTLFWIKPGNGMGTSNGCGQYVDKEKFINKYSGDYSFYLKHAK